jgi:predicted O-methyltransferase YrrM
VALEIGTYDGNTALLLAANVGADGSVVTVDLPPEFTAKERDSLAYTDVELNLTPRHELARQYQLHPLASRIRQVYGDSATIDWSRLGGPFDFVFIDADKPSTTDYFNWALKLSRPGALIFVDNVVRNGGLGDAATADADALGMRRFTEALGRERRVTASVIQTVCSKGYDGFALALVNGEK